MRRQRFVGCVLALALLLPAVGLFASPIQEEPTAPPAPQVIEKTVTVEKIIEKPVEVRNPVGLNTFRPALRGRNGMMVGGSYLTTSAGMRIMQQGGNAMDAAAAMILAASVVEHSHFAFGGQSPILVYSVESNEVSAISGIGTAPGLATQQFFLDQGGIPNGILDGTIPPMPGAVITLLDRFGTLSLAEVAQPALEYAQGYPFTEYLKENLESRKADIKEPTTLALLKQGRDRFPEVGEVYRQPDLADTIRTLIIAEQSKLAEGRHAALMAAMDEFYKGSIAREIVRFHEENGGLHRMEDYENYQTRVVPAIHTSYKGYEVYKTGSWTQGPALLEMLNILEAFDLKAMGHNSADYVHLITETMKLALADRDHHLGDPEFSSVPWQGMISKDYAAQRRLQIEMNRANLGDQLQGDPAAFEDGPVALLPAPKGLPADFELKYPGGREGTTCINVGDKYGNLVSVTPSGPTGWPSPVMGSTGIIMNARMGQFILDETVNPHNVVSPGQRPRVTLTPTIVLKDGKPFMAISTPGTERQEQAILQVFLNIVEFGMSPQEAVEAPRVETLHLHNSGDTELNKPGVLQVETRIPLDVRNNLAKRGHKIQNIGDYGMNCGVTVVEVDQVHETLVGGVDVRRDRYGIAW